jgi:hypothetical protein
MITISVQQPQFSTALVAFLLPLLVDTAGGHNLNPRFLVAPSETRYMISIGSDISSAPAILEKPSSKEHYQTVRFFFFSFFLDEVLGFAAEN